MKIGVDSYSTRNSGLDPVGVLKLADELGLQGVLFELSPFSSFQDDDLKKVRDTAEERGLYVEFGMGSVLRRHLLAQKGRELLAAAGYDASASDAQIVIDHLKIAQKLGSPILRCVAGYLFSRDEGENMAAMADDVVAILTEAAMAAQDMGMKIAVENHADFTVREWLSILARINSPAVGFTVDCANLAFDLDDPTRLAEMMAPHALTTHYKNYQILKTPHGLALGNCRLQDGDIDILAIARLLQTHNPSITINIEIHTQFAPFTLNVLDRQYFATHASPPGEGLAWYLEKSWQRPVLDTLPANLADGEQSWAREYEDLKGSVAWAKQELSSLLS